MILEIKKKVAPILNYFYDKLDVAYHEDMMYRKFGKRSKQIVDNYNYARDVLIEYVENSNKSLTEITNEELKTIFNNSLTIKK